LDGVVRLSRPRHRGGLAAHPRDPGEAGVGGKKAMLSSLRQAFLMPFRMAQVDGQEKFFTRKLVVGNRRLDEYGLRAGLGAWAIPAIGPRKPVPYRKSAYLLAWRGHWRRPPCGPIPAIARA
jgi:hypothetical protein